MVGMRLHVYSTFHAFFHRINISVDIALRHFVVFPFDWIWTKELFLGAEGKSFPVFSVFHSLKQGNLARVKRRDK